MAAGDAFRAWFPEMIEELKVFWKPDLKWNEVISFCNKMTIYRQEIWKIKNIKAAIITCRKCGESSEMKMPDISPRSLLFTLKKISIIDDEQLKLLEKSWKKYQKIQNVNAYGIKNVNE
jgi:hypothetical protein